MRIAKYMLTVIVSIGILSIALGFKVQKYSTHFLYTGVKGSYICTIKVDGVAISEGTANAAASTTPNTSWCPDVHTTIVPD